MDVSLRQIKTWLSEAWTKEPEIEDGVALALAFPAGFLESWFINITSEAHRIDLATMQDCKVVIFMEEHSDPASTKVMTSLLPSFSSLGVRSVLLELNTTTTESTRLACHKIATDIPDRTEGVEAKIVLLDSLGSYGMRYHPMDTLLSYIKLIPEAELSTLLLLTTSHKSTAEFIFDDEATMMLRNLAMAHEIAKSCITGNVLALVGRAHYGGLYSDLTYNYHVNLVLGYNIDSSGHLEGQRSYCLHGHGVTESTPASKTFNLSSCYYIFSSQQPNYKIFDAANMEFSDIRDGVLQDYIAHLSGESTPYHN